MIVEHGPQQYRHPLFPSGLGDAPPTVQAIQAEAEAQASSSTGGDKVSDLSMLLSILSSLFLIFKP